MRAGPDWSVGAVTGVVRIHGGEAKEITGWVVTALGKGQIPASAAANLCGVGGFIGWRGGDTAPAQTKANSLQKSEETGHAACPFSISEPLATAQACVPYTEAYLRPPVIPAP